MSNSTFHRRIKLDLASDRNGHISICQGTKFAVIHWLDNFSRHFASTSLHGSKPLFNVLNWSAHGIKVFPSYVRTKWQDDRSGNSSAMPSLADLLDPALHTSLLRLLQNETYMQFEHSNLDLSQVRRIPLKSEPSTMEEKEHSSLGYDGLSFFYPIDIYSENVQSHSGLLKLLQTLQQMVVLVYLTIVVLDTIAFFF